MNLYDFTIEYQKNPKGLSISIPRFSWKIESDQKNVRQTSYAIRVVCGEKTVWDSGTVLSSRSVLVPYRGEALEPEQTYQVFLNVEDNHGDQCESKTGFTTGIFEGTSFQAKMITHDFPGGRNACPVLASEIFREKKCEICISLCYGTWSL